MGFDKSTLSESHFQSALTSFGHEVEAISGATPVTVKNLVGAGFTPTNVAAALEPAKAAIENLVEAIAESEGM